MGFVELGTSCVFRDNAGEGMKKVVASCAKTLRRWTLVNSLQDAMQLKSWARALEARSAA
jgi:hypothetical protein